MQPAAQTIRGRPETSGKTHTHITIMNSIIQSFLFGFHRAAASHPLEFRPVTAAEQSSGLANITSHQILHPAWVNPTWPTDEQLRLSRTVEALVEILSHPNLFSHSQAGLFKH